MHRHPRPASRPFGLLVLLLSAVLLTACTALPSTAEDVRTNPFAYTEGDQ